jgi:hypothetical protein
MLVTPLPMACLGASRGEKTQVSIAADSLKPQGQGQGSSLMPLLGSRRSICNSSKGWNPETKAVCSKLQFTAEPHSADRSTNCFCRCIHSPPMIQLKCSAQVPCSNECTVACVHPPMERCRHHKIHRRTNPESRVSPARLSLRDFCHSPFVRG